MKKVIIGVALIAVCLSTSYPADDDYKNDDHQNYNHDDVPEAKWENDGGYQEYRKGQYYLQGQFLHYDQDGKAIWNAHNGKPLKGPDGKIIKNYKGEDVYTTKDQEDLYDAWGQAKWGPKTGTVYYGPKCVPLLDCWGKIVYGPCWAIQIPNQPTPHPNPTPKPYPHPQHPNIPHWDVPYNPETPVPKPKPIPLPKPEPVPVRPPTPIQIPKPVWVPFTDYRIPIYVPPRPNLPRPFPLPKPEIPIPRRIPGYTPKPIAIHPPHPVIIPFPVYGNCLHLFFGNGRPIYSDIYGRKLRGPNGAVLKDVNGDDVYGPEKWPALFENGKPVFNDDNGLPINGPNGQAIRHHYPHGPIVYGPKLFYKPYPGDDYKGHVVVGNLYDDDDLDAEVE